MKTFTNKALSGIAVILFMVNLDTSIVIVGLPTLVKTLHTTFAAAQWMVLSYLLAVTALIAGAGRLGDIFGKKKLYLGGIALFTLASLLCGIVGNAVLLILFRAIQGIGAAFCLSLSFAIASDLVPKEKLGKTMGILTTMIPLGIAAGPTFGGILIATLGWQSMFLINVPLGIAAYWLVTRSVPFIQPGSRTKIDWAGMLLLAAFLTCYCLGMTFMEDHGWQHPAVPILFAGAVMGLFTFVRYESRVRHPFLQLQIFRNPLFSASLSASFLVYVVIITTVVLLPFYLAKACHYPPMQVGLIMSFGPLITALLSVYAGKLADQYGARRLMLYGVLLMVIGCLCMSTITPAQGLFGFLWRMAIIQLGLTFFQTPNNTAVMEVALPEQRGLLSGLLSLSRTTGHITGTAVMGAVFALLVHYAGHKDMIDADGAAITYGVDRIFLVATLLSAFAAALIGMVIYRQKRKLAVITAL